MRAVPTSDILVLNVSETNSSKPWRRRFKIKAHCVKSNTDLVVIQALIQRPPFPNNRERNCRSLRVGSSATGPSQNSMLGDDSYAAWVKEFDTVGARERIVLRRDLRTLHRHPLISIVMPVYNPDLVYLSAAINSVRAQIYQNWELCIADDASTDVLVAQTLNEHAAADSRIKLTFRERNGHIAACSNSALQLANGEWVALLAIFQARLESRTSARAKLYQSFGRLSARASAGARRFSRRL